MLLYIYSSSMEMLGVIEKITSLIWTRRYAEPGNVKMLVPFSPENNTLLQTGNIVMKHGDTEAAEITYAGISKNLEGFEVIEAQGNMLPYWIGKRVIASQLENVEDTAQHLIQRIVRENCVETEEKRKLPGLSMGTDPEIPGVAAAYTSKKYENCLDAIEELSQSAKTGFRITTDRTTGLHTFQTYKGRDNTENNAEGNAPCIFSQEYDNVLEQEYSKNAEKYRNTAYVEGEKRDDDTHLSAIVNDTASGLERNELFVSGSNIKQTYKDDDDQEVTLTDVEYIEALKDRGREKLEQYPVLQSFSSEINAKANLIYREDFNLGDLVTCVNKTWNVRIDARISEISEIYEVDGEGLEIVFGEAAPSLYKQIKDISEGG